MNDFQEVKLTDFIVLNYLSDLRLFRVLEIKVLEELFHIFLADKLIHSFYIFAIIVGISQEKSTNTLTDLGTNIFSF